MTDNTPKVIWISEHTIRDTQETMWGVWLERKAMDKTPYYHADLLNALVEALEGLCSHWDELLNNIDCGDEYEARQAARAALAAARVAMGEK